MCMVGHRCLGINTTRRKRKRGVKQKGRFKKFTCFFHPGWWLLCDLPEASTSVLLLSWNMWELWARSSHRTDSIMKPGNSKAPLSNLGEAEIEEAEQEKLRLEVLVILLGAGIWVGRENPHRYWVHPWWNSAIWSGPFSVPSRVLLLLCFSIISPCRVAFCEHCSPTFRTNSKNPVFHAWLHALQIKTVSSQTGLLAASVWIVMKRLFECSQRIVSQRLETPVTDLLASWIRPTLVASAARPLELDLRCNRTELVPSMFRHKLRGPGAHPIEAICT